MSLTETKGAMDRKHQVLKLHKGFLEYIYLTFNDLLVKNNCCK